MTLLIASCATAPDLSTTAPVTSATDSAIAQLYRELEAAREPSATQASVMAAGQFSEAESKYVMAQKARTSAERESLATRGLTDLSNARQKADSFAAAAPALIDQRLLALKAGANTTKQAEFDAAEKQLQSMADGFYRTTTLSPGSVGLLIAKYKGLAVSSLKSSIVLAVEQALEKARRDDIDNYAPRTLRLAEEELLLASTTLEADRTREGKARVHADNAMRHLAHARTMAQQIQIWRKRDASLEDVMRYYEDGFERAGAVVDVDLDWSKGLTGAIASFTDAFKTLQAAQAPATAEVTNSVAVDSSPTPATRAPAAPERFDMLAPRGITLDRLAALESLFSPTEADVVLLQNGSLLIRAHGFNFDDDSAILDSSNLNLLNKLIDAIEQFPTSELVFSGHTDSSGGANHNRRLSLERAQAVADFVGREAGIAKARIQVEGLGEDAPLAANDTADARRFNRRIEVLVRQGAGAGPAAVSASQ
ncbi:OmpA family protein [Allohahella marinimesophila]|uniref:OmpA-like domain-containing protein n=1 Tax=Allohahella marinimesophila TaxID=1054972 RepID=A0ABP7PUP2_9GAMM